MSGAEPGGDEPRDPWAPPASPVPPPDIASYPPPAQSAPPPEPPAYAAPPYAGPPYGTEPYAPGPYAPAQYAPGQYAPPPPRPRPPLLPITGRRPPLWVPLLLIAVGLALAVRSWLRGDVVNDLGAALTRRLAVSELIAVVVIAVVVLVGRWWRSVGWVPRRGVGTAVRLIAVLQLVACLLLVVTAGAVGQAAAGTYLLIAVNCLAVGIVEETVFRGLLWAALPERWPASRVLLVTSLAFGAVHLSNGLVTGRWGAAVLQAGLAAALGLWLGAVRLRTGWLGPSIVLHAVHDAAAAGVAVLAGSDVMRDLQRGRVGGSAGFVLSLATWELVYGVVLVSGVVVWIRLVVDERREARRPSHPEAGPAVPTG
ncbi:MAG: CPBP family intramembrane glutamic endopeptidase [Candidatus Nanopelagicales bacterium]